MATLVLTTVGGAIGGPIGAALGAVLGQAVDQRLLAPAPRQGPRLTDLAVQTSSYGTQIPRVFGTMRIAGTVIWATDLIESRARQRGAKGQPSSTSYSYAASFAVALSSRPVIRVERIWADGNLLRGAAGDWKSAGGFRLHRGGEDQPVDPLIASVSQPTPAHRGIAYAVFEELQLADFGNRIPSLTFEVVADEGAVPIGTIARDLAGGAILGAGPAETVEGFAASGSSVAGSLDTLSQVASAWFVPEAGGLAMRNAAVDPLHLLDADATRETVRGTIDAVPISLALSHYDPARDYRIGTQHARRRGAGWREAAMELPAVLSATQARRVADTALLTREAARIRRRVTADIASIGVVPGQAVRIEGEADRWRVTSAAIEGLQVRLELLPIAPSAATRPADAGKPVPPPDRRVGRTLIEVFELPPLYDTPVDVPRLLVAAGGTELGWRSAFLSLSRDGIAWEDIGATAFPATIGMIEAPVPATTASLVDRIATISVAFPHDDIGLVPADEVALDRGANLALVGDELIQFAGAERLAPGRWRLRSLWRGRRGTDVAAHAAGARFVMIEPASLLPLPLPGATIPTTIVLSATGIGDDGQAQQRHTALSGRSVAPPSPVHLHAHRDAQGDLHARWRRRSRRGWRWIDGVDAPLVEEREAYRLTIETASNVRHAVVEVDTLLVPAAEIGGGAVTLTVRQIGTLAESPPAIITI